MKNQSPVTNARPGQVYRMKDGVTAQDFLRRYSSYRNFVSSISSGNTFTLGQFKNNRVSIDGEGEVDVFAYHTPYRSGLELAISNQMIAKFFDEVKEIAHVICGKRYKHVSTGNEYMVLHLANIAVPNPSHPVQVVYIGDNGNVWTKTLEEFKQKFTEL